MQVTDLINCLRIDKKFYYRYIPLFRKWIESQRVFILIDEYGNCSDYCKHILGTFSNLDSAVFTLLKFYKTNGTQLNIYSSLEYSEQKWYKYPMAEHYYTEQFIEMHIDEFILNSVCPLNVYSCRVYFTPKVKYIFHQNKLIQMVNEQVTNFSYHPPKFFIDFISN